MFRVEDTIVAISTPHGRGAMGIVRLSGPAAMRIVGELIGREEPLVRRVATFARLSLETPRGASAEDPRPLDAALGDEVVVTWFPSPRSYTGEDVVEISAHGSPVVLQGILRAAVHRGARLAEPGEFTLRAFLNGKRDLVQAEAVADLIEAVTPLQARAAFDQLEGTLTSHIARIDALVFDLMARLEASLDFPDEGFHFVQQDDARRELADIRRQVGELLASSARGRLIREGAEVAIVGTPNVGKSSLFNALLNTNRAIVTSIPGTTRDLLTERVDMRGVAVSLVDTAGIRESSDPIEQEGVRRAEQTVTVADVSVVVLDRSRPLSADDRRVIERVNARPRVIVANKMDLPPAWASAELGDDVVEVSVETGAGVTDLVERITMELGAGEERRDLPLVSNVRHIELLETAGAALSRAADALDQGVSEEFVLADLQDASSSLQAIAGRRTTEDLLAHIFARFCVGK